MKKKLVAVLTAVMMTSVFAVACGSTEAPAETETAVVETVAETVAETETAVETVAETETATEEATETVAE